MTLELYILFTILLGFIPPVFWLLFWLREDMHPEPKREIFIVFFAGMGSVLIAIILETNFFNIAAFFKKIFDYDVATLQLINVIGFAFIEEIVKTSAAFFTALRSRYFDEPVDAMVYLVTASLGFAALENAFFVADSLKKVGLNESLIVSSFRFANAILLHISSAAIIGAGFAFSFFHKERRIKELALALIFATALHALYNFFILKSTEPAWGVPSQALATLLVMAGAAAGLVLFEKARKLTR